MARGEMTGRGRSAFLWSARVGLAAGLVLVGLLAYRALVLDGLPLTADEAGHALPAARLALALGRGDVGGFAAASLRELVWPFVHPWVTASFFLVFGISAQVARASSLLTFAAALCLVPPLARAVSPPGPEGAGPAPPMLGWPSMAILAATAPWPIVCAVMGEPLGMLLTLLTLWAAARAAGERGVAVHALCGLLAAAAFLTKYGYGVPLIAALLLALAWRVPERGWRPLLGALAGSLTPLLAWGGAVFAREPQRLEELLGILRNKDEGLRGLENALFYARALVDFVGWPLAIAVLILLVATVVRRVEPARLPAVLLVASALLLLTLHPNKQTRYLWPVLPVLLVLAETEAAWRLRLWRGGVVLWPAAAVITFLVGSPLSRITQAETEAAGFRGARAIVGFAADAVAARQPVLFLGTTGLLPHYALTWELVEREGREPEVDLLTYPGDAGWDPRFRQGYPAGTRPEYAQRLGEALATRRYGSVVALELGAGSPFRPPWLAKWDAWGQNYVQAMSEQAGRSGYVLQAERGFPADEAVVRVYVPMGTRP